MPRFVFAETPDSRASNGNPPTMTLKYRASGDGAESEAFVHAYALQASPRVYNTIYGTIFRQDIQLEPVGYKLWHVTVPYDDKPVQLETWTWNYDSTGGSFHIKASKGTVARYGFAPNCGGLIGVKGNGDTDVEGADIVIPALKLNVQYHHTAGELDLDYAMFIADLTGTVNSTPMFNRAPGEVLFLGGTGSDGTQAPVEGTYQFAISRNLQGLIVGAISGINKDGWDLAWIRWTDAADLNAPCKQPQGVYIERVYDRIDLRGFLGFG
jgi:hypothetical protein